MNNRSSHIKYRNKNKMIASFLTLLLLASGTFAWQSFSQKATNETIVIVGNAGARLHDYFNGTTKQVFIENYLDNENDPENVYARIKLLEYLEHGSGVGLLEGDDGYDEKSVQIIRGDLSDENLTPNINNKETWDTYYFDIERSDSAINAYFNIEMGGDAIFYMPTFNQNNMSLKSDINGTLAGMDGERYSDTAYDDYCEYTETSVKDDYITYLDPDTKLEVEEKELTQHKAKATLSSSVISMEQWIEDGATLGDYWVYDTDGWAYWANPIPPETATGLLISGIENVQRFGDDQAYYGIHVISQIATANDWGNEDTLTGMHEDITQEGIHLMETITTKGDTRTSRLIELTNMTAEEIKNMVGKDEALEIDGVAYYVLDVDTIETYTNDGTFLTEEEAVLLWMEEPLNNSLYTFDLLGGSIWETSDLRKVLESAVNSDHTLDEMVLRVETTVMPYSGSAVDTYDRLYPLSYEEFVESYELEGTNRAKSSDDVATYSWLRSPFMNTNVIMLHNTNASVNNFVEAKYIGTVRPVFWAAL